MKNLKRTKEEENCKRGSPIKCGQEETVTGASPMEEKKNKWLRTPVRASSASSTQGKEVTVTTNGDPDSGKGGAPPEATDGGQPAVTGKGDPPGCKKWEEGEAKADDAAVPVHYWDQRTARKLGKMLDDSLIRSFNILQKFLTLVWRRRVGRCFWSWINYGPSEWIGGTKKDPKSVHRASSLVVSSSFGIYSW